MAPLSISIDQTSSTKNYFKAATIASPNSLVVAFPPKSAVRVPESNTVRTASSTRRASVSMFSE